MLVGICGQKKAAEELTQLMQEGARGVVRGGRMQEAAAAGYGLSQWGVVYRAMQGRVSEQH
jgi:hypothetical protein